MAPPEIRSSSKLPGRILVTLSALSILGALVLDGLILHEAYGPEAPFYGCSENMDKWSSPLPILLGINGAAAAITAALLLVRSHLNRRRV